MRAGQHAPGRPCLARLRRQRSSVNKRLALARWPWADHPGRLLILLGGAPKQRRITRCLAAGAMRADGRWAAGGYGAAESSTAFCPFRRAAVTRLAGRGIASLQVEGRGGIASGHDLPVAARGTCVWRRRSPHARYRTPVAVVAPRLHREQRRNSLISTLVGPPLRPPVDDCVSDAAPPVLCSDCAVLVEP
jgi:hypothetical protein